jgi:hypothetical protein
MPRRPIPLGTSFHNGRSPSAGLQSACNFYVEEVKAEGRSQIILLGTPGKALFSSSAGIPRGQLTANSTHYVVAGTTLWSISSAGVKTSIGTIEGSALVRMAFNGINLEIVADLKSYSLDTTTGIFAEITDANFEPASDVVSLASYSIFLVKNTGRIRWRLAGAAFSANDFATAEAESDNLKFLVKIGNEIVLGGENSQEYWYATGLPGADAFAKSSTSAVSIGGTARDTALEFDSGLNWVGRDGKAGGGSVYRNGKKISTPDVDLLIESVADKSVLHAFPYQQAGHLFYVLTNPLEWSVAWDMVDGVASHGRMGRHHVRTQRRQANRRLVGRKSVRAADRALHRRFRGHRSRVRHAAAPSWRAQGFDEDAGA